VNWENELIEDELFKRWKERVQNFVNDYKEYYFIKYQNWTTQEFPLRKFESAINAMIKKNDNFYSLLNEMVYNTNQYAREVLQCKDEKWSIEELLTDPLGNSNWNLCVFIIKLLFKETVIKNLLSTSKINI
jgi:hypothetical protein